MIHYILVKWSKEVGDKAALLEKVRALYAKAKDIPGVRGVTLKPNVTPRDNRYDLMIAIDMEKDALPTWDESALHKTWKAEYGSLVEKKAIFDSED